MIVIDDVKQGSDSWFKLKLGIPGSSSFDKIITTTGAISKQRTDYLYKLSAEILTGNHEETYQSAAMTEGLNREDESRALYEMITDTTVQQVGVIFKDEQRRFLCSPDGIVNNEWGFEMKNVLPKTQVGYLMGNKLPTQYICQVQGSLLVTGFDRWDFFSYSPGLKPLIIKVERDENFIGKLAPALDDFCLELAILVNKLKAM